MGLNTSPHDPCLLSNVISNPSSPDTISAVQSQLHVKLYVDDLVFYSSDPTQEALFKTLLQEHIQVDFMVDVDYFLGTAFTWLKHKGGNISAHLCQSEFTEFTAHYFLVQTTNKVHNMTPYCSGLPIDSITTVDPSIAILHAEDRSIIILLVSSIDWQLALALTLPLYSTLLPHT